MNTVINDKINKFFNLPTKYSDKKTTDELKKQRDQLHKLAVFLTSLKISLLIMFLLLWCGTTETTITFALAILLILFYVETSVVVQRRDRLSILIYLKEHTETT